MKRVNGAAIVLALVLAVASAPVARAETNIAGAWIVTLDLVNSKATIEANIKQNDGKLAAEVITPAGHLEFSGTLVNDKITASYLLQVQGNSLEIRMNGVVNADTLSGTIEFGPGQEVKWTAVRKPAPSESESTGTAPAHGTPAETVPEGSK